MALAGLRRASWLLAFLALPAAVAQAEPLGPPAVTATGRAELEVAPDRAIVRIGVRGTGKTASEAAKAGATRSQQVLDALRAKLGPGDRAESASNRVEPVRVYEEGKPPRITGYAAEHGIRVVTARLQELGALLDAVTAAADVAIESVGFEIADPGPPQANALRQAARDARTRASAIAEGLGLGLGPVRIAREVGASTPSPPGEMRMRAAASDAATPVVAPQLRVTGEVEVTFELVGGPRP